ncbi:hypothetical protein ACHAWF_013906 [Thalassiosira exigua]
MSDAVSCRDYRQIFTDGLIETGRRIEEDDPDLTELTIHYHIYRPHDVDWLRDGEVVARNTHIKKL